jgi:hypothetical protein
MNFAISEWILPEMEKKVSGMKKLQTNLTCCNKLIGHFAIILMKNSGLSENLLFTQNTIKISN